jgi:GTP cyclohydrolase I
MNLSTAEEAVASLLDSIDIPNWREDENFKETPRRVAKAYKELTKGLDELENHIVVFPSNYDGIIHFNDIQAVGLCPHHLLPIEYKITFAYIPTGKVLGLSKIPRIIKHLSARPVLQEDLTRDIRDYFVKKLEPLGVAVLVKGIHGCMKYRGITEAEEVTTVNLAGTFMDIPQTREEFYNLL